MERNVSKDSIQGPLPLLYPNGNSVSVAKKKDLLELIEFISPIYHNFFHSLKSSSAARDEIPIVDKNDEA